MSDVWVNDDNRLTQRLWRAEVWEVDREEAFPKIYIGRKEDGEKNKERTWL